MRVCEFIASFLEGGGITHVFELTGGMITFMLDAIDQKTNIKIISMHHEQAAAFAAEGMGRMTGRPGVALATSGPGAVNLLTAIGSCYFDSIPAVFITGQVNRGERKGDRRIRQLGFQETDIVSMARPITKDAVEVWDPAEIPAILTAAFDRAVEGRPGPVLVDIPLDVQRAEITVAPSVTGWRPPPKPNNSQAAADAHIDRLLAAVAAAARPLILAGGGVHAAGALQNFRVLADAWGVPVVHSLMAADALPYDHPARVGLIGSYGNRWANTALAECDLLLVLGSRLDVRQTGANTQAFKDGRDIFHVDCDIGEMNNRVVGCDGLKADLGPYINRLAERVVKPWSGPDWTSHISAARARWPDDAETDAGTGVNPNLLMRRLSHHAAAAAAFVLDVGQHQMWAAQSLRLRTGQRLLTSGGMGAMGFALPTAIGAHYATGWPMMVIAGDGGFQLNIQELQTVARGRLPLKILVLNNHCHGMVRQFQSSYLDNRLRSTMWGYSAPSFAAVAAAYGLAAANVRSPADMESGLESLWRDPMEPYLLEVEVEPMTNVHPKVAFGRPLSDMEPEVKPLDVEGT